MPGSRILIIGLNYAPEPVGIGPYTQGLAEALVQGGHTVSVICGQPYYPQWRRQAGFASGYRTTCEEGVSVTRCPHYIPADPTGLKRIVHLASFALSSLPAALRMALRRDRPDTVIAVAPALLAVLTAWIAARLAGARLWVHVQDFEAEAAVATGLLREGGLAARLALALERFILRRADRVSTISPQMVARLAAKGVDPARALELRNWADDRFVPDAAGAAALRRQWGLEEHMVALYSGNIARKQGIEVLVDAARLLERRTDIAFVICGEGPNRAALERRAAGLPNVQLRDLQPAERMGATLAMADLHLLPQIAGAADLVLPSKLTNMLASGRTIVATTEPGTGLYTEVEGCGVLTPPENAEALAAAIAALADDPARRAVLGAAAAARASDRWSKAAIIARWAAALDTAD
ncbi:colanic acid biosynthesis glycosyl transferase WcaI [Novosphingobium kunmingense]|uniref:Colanic acid biosynthesis glycosyl transferase WcaI n=1 Tax=Novosphingobium kunmingense TaxID=1211806 RepID=A0A2N0H7P6_9SPHN|nr:WcaI family glycosyltransferase [Novosphingobium kunmingense]PKB14910.1 colanic acid biosynthesis glycosyl transferase WcaI [Novosphingobium kunmingense]